MEMHNYTKFPIFCLMWFTVPYLVRFISLAENLKTHVQYFSHKFVITHFSGLAEKQA